MQTLLYGKAASLRSEVAAILTRRGHDVQVCARPDEARQHCAETDPPLLVLILTDEADLDACREIWAGEKGIERTILIVLPDESGASMLDILEDHGIDDFYLGTVEAARFNARMQFLERKVHAKRRRRLSEAELAARARQQAVVAELGKQALARTDVQTMLDYAVQGTVAALNARCGVILTAETPEATFRLQAAWGWEPALPPETEVPPGPAYLPGYALHDGAPIVIDDAAAETRFALPPWMLDADVRSGLCLVIDGRTQPFGVLAVFAPAPGAFGKQDVDFVQAVVNILSETIKARAAEEALRESEAKARAILSTTVDGIITIDERGCIESFNAAAERIFGYTAEEVIGKNVRVLMPSPYREEHDGYIENYHRTGRRKIIGIGREIIGQRKNGEIFPMDLAVSEVRLNGRRIYSGIVRDISSRRQMEREILRISDQERRRIGQDLHDGLGQMLTGIGLISQSLARQMEKKGLEEARQVQEIAELIQEADQYARSLTRGLTPVELDAGGLMTALRRLASNAERLFGIRCDLVAEEEVPVHDNSVATHLYRIAQEAVSNAVKHGKATHVTIHMERENDEVILRVVDDGVGFPEMLDEEKRGMGVHIMRYRARIMGAKLDIRRRESGGTEIRCQLPRPEAAMTSSRGHRP